MDLIQFLGAVCRRKNVQKINRMFKKMEKIFGVIFNLNFLTTEGKIF